MIFKLNIDRECREEIIANVHQRTPLIDEIERMVTQDGTSEQLTGYTEDEIVMLDIREIECFTVEDEKTYAVYKKGKRYLIRKRLYELEEILPGDFVKLSKSAIANRGKIVKFKVQLSGAVDAVFESGNVECISRRCFAEMKRRYGL
ncbi:MAG: LytTR family transcriptional regulator [Lachnospiraceae bacterium]|nr:LytTR family transcriptional regulator [Lachnospiraceae bacterium]